MRQRDGGWRCCSPRDHVPVSQVTLSRGATSHVTRMDRHYTGQVSDVTGSAGVTDRYLAKAIISDKSK